MLLQPRKLPFLTEDSLLTAKLSSVRRIMSSNSPDLNALHCHVCSAMLNNYHQLQLKSKTTDELKVALQTICEELPQEHINKTAANFMKCLTAYMAVTANDGHVKHLQ